ncbi:hypothetical protein DL766_006672 [Monosporascus sp. MC13-8B]|uniref:Cytochrome c domain-containing protein n=1 Tax=Monosporascus cannonballus TaxID=155416 RepID=A0ABY0H4J7_9PEZI|nr:hypothetical protein DL763_010514 [Monosporascus cannonballus]RYO81495.1 hypothetical protein DL762_007072 [Monosporascus cannonballus]RYP26592.1 hypothetical protein DL766_006672 [Monosporascus sp. MC13-8B]
MAPTAPSTLGHLSTLGVRPIHLACLEGNFEEVMKLAKVHSYVDLPLRPTIHQPAHEPTWPSGETPLMLAALMGQIKIFEYLVRRGARYDKRDEDGFPPQSYSSEKPFAVEKRTLFLKKGIGKEHPKASHAREVITDLLDNPARLQVLVSCVRDSGYPNISLGKHGKKIMLLACVGEFDTGEVLGMEKTIGGVMIRGSQSVLKFAVSGFKGRSAQHDPRVLDREFWNRIALTKVARIIGFKFHGNLHDNGARRPLPHHVGRVQAGHVEVQLATYYVIEMGDRHAQGQPGGETWSTMRKLRALRSAHLGEERDAGIFISSQPCSSCHKYVQALSNYTKITFFIQGGAAMGPTIRSKTGRGRMAVDEVMHTFADEDAQPDPSDGEADEGDESDAMDAMVVRPLVTRGALPRDENRNDSGAATGQSQVIVLDDATEEEDAAWDSDDSESTMAFTAPPSPPDMQDRSADTQFAFAPPPEQQPPSAPTLKELLKQYTYVPNAAPTREKRKPRPPRTYEERMRYRNPWPAPIWYPPEYLTVSSSSERPHTRQRSISPVPRLRGSARDIARTERLASFPEQPRPRPRPGRASPIPHTSRGAARDIASVAFRLGRPSSPPTVTERYHTQPNRDRDRDQGPAARRTGGEEIPAWARAAYRDAGFLP